MTHRRKQKKEGRANSHLGSPQFHVNMMEFHEIGSLNRFEQFQINLFFTVKVYKSVKHCALITMAVLTVASNWFSLGFA